jgi:hypothetical protein
VLRRTTASRARSKVSGSKRWTVADTRCERERVKKGSIKTHWGNKNTPANRKDLAGVLKGRSCRAKLLRGGVAVPMRPTAACKRPRYSRS